MAYALFDRKYVLHVGDLSISELDIEFNAKRSLGKDSSKCDIKVYNLAAKSRAMLVEKTNQFGISLLAGYSGQTADEAVEIFTGLVTRLVHYTDGPNYVTHIKAVDTLAPKQTASKGLSTKDTTAEAEIRKLLKEANIDKGNFDEFMKGRDPKKMTRYVTTKAPFDAVVELTRSLEGEVTIQSGKAFFIGLGAVTGTSLIVLDSTTGLIGSPDIGRKNFVTAKALIQPGFIPGHGISIKGESTVSAFRIESVQYMGDLAGQNWYAQLELSLTDGVKVVPENPDDDKPIYSVQPQ